MDDDPSHRSLLQKFTVKTPEARKKALATKKAKKEQRASQTIHVDDNWRIIRADQLNWEVQHRFKNSNWKFWGYFGKLADALRTLPATMLDEVAKNPLEELTTSLKAISMKVREAVEQARKEELLLK